MCSINDPEVLKRRGERRKALDAAVKDMLARAPGRVPSWHRERRMQMDRVCLQHSKRCIMWDDEGSGFYLVSAHGTDLTKLAPLGQQACAQAHAGAQT